MSNAAPKAIAIAKALDAVMQKDRGRLLSVLISRLGDFQLAEDALQDASISALTHWSRSGVPHSPQAWLLTVASRKAIDRIRRRDRESAKAVDLTVLAEERATHIDPETIPDERLRLIFTCCHPALEDKTRVALTLRAVCGLSTTEVADAFLDTATAMGQRLSRAKAKIKAKGIAYLVPEADQWSARLETVLTTLYLIFTTGYIAGRDKARDLCGEALFLARLMNDLKRDDPEIEGVLALILMTHARRAARVGADGASLPPADQNRSLWDQKQIDEGRKWLDSAMEKRRPGPFQIKAAISDCHMADGGSDWPQISFLYQSLWRHEPTSVVALNGAVALAETGKVTQALSVVESLAGELSNYQPWHACRANLLAKTGNHDEARQAYRRAIAETHLESEALYLQARLEVLSG